MCARRTDRPPFQCAFASEVFQTDRSQSGLQTWRTKNRSESESSPRWPRHSSERREPLRSGSERPKQPAPASPLRGSGGIHGCPERAHRARRGIPGTRSRRRGTDPRARARSLARFRENLCRTACTSREMGCRNGTRPRADRKSLWRRPRAGTYYNPKGARREKLPRDFRLRPFLVLLATKRHEQIVHAIRLVVLYPMRCVWKEFHPRFGNPLRARCGQFFP